jgi:hypothetical protein
MERQSRMAAAGEEEIDLLEAVLGVWRWSVAAAHLAEVLLISPACCFSCRRRAGARPGAPQDPIAFSFMCRDSIEF